MSALFILEINNDKKRKIRWMKYWRMGDSISPLKLKQVTKKRRVNIDKWKCFICKSTSKDSSNPGDVGKKTFTDH